MGHKKRRPFGLLFLFADLLRFADKPVAFGLEYESNTEEHSPG